MTEKEWLAFQEHLRELERRYTKEVLYRYGGDGPRAELYFMGDGGMERGYVMRHIACSATLRVRNNKGGDSLLEDRDFHYRQLYTKECYEKHMKELRAKGKIYLLVCKVCGKEFDSKTKERDTCSAKCTGILKSRSAKGLGITISTPMTEEERQRICPVCGMPFRAETRSQKCCSRACGTKLTTKKLRKKSKVMKLSDTLKGCKL